MATNRQYKIIIKLDGKDDASDDLRRVNKQITTMDDKSRNAVGGIGGLNKELGQFGLGLSALGLARGVVKLNELGREVTSTKITFEEMSGGATAAAASLAYMRRITGNVIDDLTLMTGANKLLVTGLADTNEKAAELVNLGSRLGAAMGQDAADGIENLNAALLNNSYLRLDTLGISAAAARERVKELVAAGLDMSAAFSQAVLELGTQTLDDLGVAASAGETSVARLTTQFKNLTQQLAEFTAQGVEAGAQLIELGILSTDEGLNAVVNAGIGRDLTGPEIEIINALKSLGEVGSEATGIPLLLRLNKDLLETLGLLDAGEEAAEEMGAALEAGFDPFATREFTIDVSPTVEGFDIGDSLINELQMSFRDFQRSSGGGFFDQISGQNILGADEFQTISSDLTSLEVQFERLQFLAEEGLISESELANAEGYLNFATDIAGQAEAAALAWENMSLAQALGATGGGRLGELGDLVLADIEDTELRATIQLAFDLESGRTTDIEQAFETQFSDTIALIAEEMGSEAATDALVRALAAFEQGTLAGLSDEQIIALTEQAIGFRTVTPTSRPAGSTTLGNVAPLSGDERGSSLEEIQGGGTTQSIDELLDLVQSQVVTISEGMTEVAETDLSPVVDPFISDMDIANESLTEVENSLSRIANTEYRARMPIELFFDDETGIQLARKPFFARAIQVVVENNGGVVPGTEPQ